MNPLYLTTAIPFVNAAPHLGHALELVQTDAIARHARARRRSVRFLTGTDEHAPKNALAAAAAGIDTRAFVDRNAERFRGLAESLEVSNDDFIRTSSDPRHRPTVEAIWRACRVAGDLYRATYAGWYCAGCESFVERICDEHDTSPEFVEEENWYFRLSRYAAEVRTRIERGDLRIVPAERANEVLAFLDGEVRDLSVSRSRARARGWGIPVPGDPAQTVYVWFDALVNYLSAAPPGWWSDAVAIRHVIGKGIVRFHAVVWPAILLSAGLPLPNEIFVHDYVTTAGRKIAKSSGNAVDPIDLVDAYGVDAVRWWLLREVPRVGEADFTEARLVAATNRDLAHGVGNLVQRVVALAAKDPVGGAVPASDAFPLLTASCETTRAIDAALDEFDLRKATTALGALVDDTNRYLERTRPWSLPPAERSPVISAALHATRRIVAELEPFTPGLARRCAGRLGAGAAARTAGTPVVPRLELVSS
jgi:methionyl-tRNA synthetase